MGLWDKLTGEFIDIIEWLDDSNDTLVWRFERHQNEIKNGAQLTVRQNQVAVFVNEGQIADVFVTGMHTLNTQNLPILSTLKGWKYGFDSPFKAEVYFINLRLFTDIKWGTKNPVMLRDPEFGPVRIRAFGNFTFKVADPGKFLNEIVGTDSHFTVDEIESQLKSIIASKFSDSVAESKIPVLDLASNYDELSELLHKKMQNDFLDHGLSIAKFIVENISLPPNVEEALDKRSSMGILGNLNQYTQYQAANAMEEAAKNPGGDAASGIGMGMGFGMANQMAQTMAGQQANTSPATNNTPNNSAPQTPPPLPQESQFYVGVNGQQTGPFTLSELKQQAQSKQFIADHLVWKEGMAGWEKAGEVSELKPLFASIPPPLPPVG